jgi:hypothetical protein
VDSLRPFRELDGRGGQAESDLRKLHTYTLGLAKKIFVEDLRPKDHLQRDAADPYSNDQQGIHRHGHRTQLMAKLVRLKPGATTGIRAIRRAEGGVAIAPEDKVQELRRHWAEIFRGKPFDAAATDARSR